MISCFGYTRVSTVKQGEGVSLEAQREEIQRYASKHNLTIIKWFEEKETAAKSGRPIFDQMIKELTLGRARGFVVHKIDRSARNFRDWASIAELADQGIDVHFATETLDFRSRGGRLTADIQAVIAADYIRNLRDETIKGLKGRLQQGLYPYKAPLGYLNQGGGKVKIPDPERAPLIREMFELYGSGRYSFRSLQMEMANRGLKNENGRPLSRSSIEKLLNNSFYTGVITIRRTGETYQGRHDPLISASLFDRVQDVKAGRTVRKTTRHAYLYRGLLKCAQCRCQLTGERQKGRVYYRCHTRSCPQKTLREDRIDAMVCDLFARCQIRETNFKALMRDMKRWFDTRSLPVTGTEPVDMRRGRLEARIDKLTDLVIDGVLDHETFLNRKMQLEMQLRRFEEEERNGAETRTDVDTLQKFFELIKSLAGLYRLANHDEKRLLLELTTSNRHLSSENLEFKPSDWLELGQKILSAPGGCPSRATLRTRERVQIPHLEAFLEATCTLKQRDEMGSLLESVMKKPV